MIALVITIIILLILATVTILALTGENGLFSIAKEARTETQAKSEEEQIKLEVMASWDEKGDLLFNTVKGNLEHIQGIESITDNDFPITITFSKTGNKFTVSSGGEIEKKCQKIEQG